MKFETALHEALDKEELKVDGLENTIAPHTAKILAIIWNMQALSKNVLDDIVYIDKHNNIVSIPLQKSSTKKTTAKKKTVKKKVEDKNNGGKESKQNN